MAQADQEITPTIFFCLPDFSGGGAERVMTTLMSAFANTNKHYCCVLSETGPLRERVPDEYKIINLGCTSARLAVPRLVRLFRKEKPKIIFSTLAYFNFVVLAALFFSGHRPQRIIVREANSPRSTLLSLPAQWLGKLFYKILYNRADIIICNANYVRSELIKLGVTPELIIVIPNPVDIKTIRKLALQKCRLQNLRIIHYLCLFRLEG